MGGDPQWIMMPELDKDAKRTRQAKFLQDSFDKRVMRRLFGNGDAIQIHDQECRCEDFIPPPPKYPDGGWVGQRFEFTASKRIAEIVGEKDFARLVTIRFPDDNVEVDVPMAELLRDAKVIADEG